MFTYPPGQIRFCYSHLQVSTVQLGFWENSIYFLLTHRGTNIENMEEISFVENPRELLDHAFQIPDVVTFHFSLFIFDF